MAFADLATLRHENTHELAMAATNVASANGLKTEDAASGHKLTPHFGAGAARRRDGLIPPSLTRAGE
jgi:hypothetical protein